MSRSRLLPALAAVLLAASVSLASAAPASAAGAYAFVVMGDVPYGSTQINAFPGYISKINAASDVQLVAHLGDISNPLNCSSSYFSTIKAQFDRVSDPLLYTPGDNEWADCKGATTGAGDPLAKLATLRSIFFPRPGTSLGVNKIGVTAQSGHPENVTVNAGGLTFGMVHAVGSWNDLAPWRGNPSATSAQRSEVSARISADVQLIKDAFSRAKSAGSRAVVLITQADMFISGQNSTYKSGFQSIVQTIATQSLSFGKPVFLINGDTHAYRSDKPLTSSTWKSYYGVSSSVPNLSRITIQGGTSEYTKFTVTTSSSVLGWQRVPS